MKATLEFDLDAPEDKEAHMRCVKSSDLSLLLWDLDSELRSKVKHCADDTPKEKVEAFEEIRTLLHQLMSEYNIDLEELMS